MAVLQPKPVEQTFNYKFTPQPKTSSDRSVSNDIDFSSLYSSYLRSRTTTNYPTEDRDTEPIRPVQATYHYRTEAPPTYQYPYTGYSSSRYQPATSYTYDSYRYPANTPSYGGGGYGGNAFAINSGFNIGGLGIGSGLGISLG
uniref:Uncharacterized protein n=1 Tax=Acrobeloides nanus TaxID=290746 RepID=A0A914DM44_9BILA